MDATKHDLWHERKSGYNPNVRKRLHELHQNGFNTTPMDVEKLNAVIQDFPKAQRHSDADLAKLHIKNVFVPKNFEDKRIHG